MEFIFEIIDKSRRKIHLSKERWNHVLRHPEMANQIERITETLQYPTTILQFWEDPKVHFYFRYYKDKREYLFVSVKYLNGDGFLITSYYTDIIK